MTFSHTLGAVLLYIVTFTIASPWTFPEPTIYAPASDAWIPAPTPAPELYGSGLDLFKRQASEGDNTCGFLNGSQDSSITCHSTNFICATNTYYGVHGCCDPVSLSSCIIPTTCIARTAMSSLCTDGACSSNAMIAKCTASGLGECYKWLFVYSSTVMTQHGCADTGFTSSVSRSWGVGSASLPTLIKTVVVTAVPATSSPAVPITGNAGRAGPSIGLIAGATIGGCTIVSLLVFLVCVVHRRRKAAKNSTTQYQPASMMEYDANGFPVTYVESDHKVWQRHHAVCEGSIPQYPGMQRTDVVEVDGRMRPAEAPT